MGKELGHAAAYTRTPAKAKALEEQASQHAHASKWASNLTKREWFAGMAMAGILANLNNARLLYRELGEESVKYADHVLMELAECPTKTGDG